MMKMIPPQKLFWFLKNNLTLDLSKPAILEMYMQQVLSRGRRADVKSLLSAVSFDQFQSAFSRIKRFLPLEVRRFWEDFLENH